MTDNELRALWRNAGGKFHGPHIETGTMPESQLLPFLRSLVAAERESDLIALREWAVARWRDEVQHRPLVNRYRRPLDDTWRQVMRYAGLDPDEAVGPSHDALLAASGEA